MVAVVVPSYTLSSTVNVTVRGLGAMVREELT
jgi:hypothetical protein